MWLRQGHQDRNKQKQGNSDRFLFCWVISLRSFFLKFWILHEIEGFLPMKLQGSPLTPSVTPNSITESFELIGMWDFPKGDSLEGEKMEFNGEIAFGKMMILRDLKNHNFIPIKGTMEKLHLRGWSLRKKILVEIIEGYALTWLMIDNFSFFRNTTTIEAIRERKK